MTFNAFAERKLQITIKVTRPNAQGAQTDFTYVWTENRMRVAVREGGKQFGNARIEVYGVALASMNNIARLWLEALTPQNTDTVEIAAWTGQQFVPFFQGVIAWSAVDESAMPQTKLVLEANSAFGLGNLPASPYSNAGPVTLADTLTTISAPAQLSLVYAPTAPTYMLTDVRLTGSPLDQVGALMRHFSDLTWTVHLQQLVVRAANAPISADAVRIAADTGMQNAPVYSTSGLQLSTLFNPQIRPGVALDVHTQADFVNRTIWVAAVLAHQLDANFPGGQWSTAIAANSYGSKGNATN